MIGSGAAGLTLALQLAKHARVTLLAKGSMAEGCTLHAQGGIAAVLDKDDSVESHVEDTLNAGAGLCDPEVVHYVAENAADAIQSLISNGVKFTRERHEDGVGGYHLTREGGHSHRRVIHAADATGSAIETNLHTVANILK